MSALASSARVAAAHIADDTGFRPGSAPARPDLERSRPSGGPAGAGIVSGGMRPSQVAVVGSGDLGGTPPVRGPAGRSLVRRRPSRGGSLGSIGSIGSLGEGNGAAGLRIQRCGIGSSCDCPPHEQLAGVERDLSLATAAGGTPLPETSRARMETAFSFDFAPVRVHTGAAAHDATSALGARALTAGTDILFRAGEYQPGSPGGDRLLAHELAHVVQQAHGLPQGLVDTGASGHLEQAAGLAADRANPAAEHEARGAALAAAVGGPVPALSHQPLAIARQDDVDGGSPDADATVPAGTADGPTEASPLGGPNSCFSCNLEGGLSICCPTPDFDKLPEWDKCSQQAADKYDSCMKERHNPKACLAETRCFICQCLGSKGCTCTGAG